MSVRTGPWPWRALFAGLSLTILYLALSPRPPESVDTGWDKLNHVVAFAALAWSGTFSGSGSRRWLALLGAGLLAFGGGIELVQSLIPERAGEWSDLGADAVGVAAGLSAALLMRTRWQPA